MGLKRAERSPFLPDDELPGSRRTAGQARRETTSTSPTPGEGGRRSRPAADKPAVPAVVVDVDGLETRLLEVPVPAGNYSNLSMDAKRLYFISRPDRAATARSR